MRLKFWIGVGLSVGLLVFLFSRIDLALLWRTLRSVSLPYIAATLVFVVFFFWVRALRWRYLMDPVKPDVPVGSLFSATMIGFMANNVLPARLGEFVRAYALGRREDVSKGAVFGTVVVERLFDGMSVLLLLIVALVLMPPEVAGATAGTLRKAGAASLAAYAAVIAAIAFFVKRPDAPVRLARAVVAPFSAGLADKAALVAASFINGLRVVRDPRLMGFIVLYTVIHWGLLPGGVYLLFKAFGLGFGVYEAVFIFVLACVGVALPSTPGYVGTFHAAVAGGMVLLGMDKEAALGFAIVTHAVNYVPVTLIGFYCLYRENLSFSGIRKVEADAKA